MLQWGRRLLATERSTWAGHTRRRRDSFNGAVASWRRKGVRAHRPAGGLRVASMGPSPLGDGKIKKGDPFERAGWRLQWGRRLLATESVGTLAASACPTCFNGAVASWRRKVASAAAGALVENQLQWGRRLLATESALSQAVLTCAASGFNGAVASWRRKGPCGTANPARRCDRFNGAVASWRRKGR